MSRAKTGQKREKWNVEKPARKREREEFGRGQKGVVLCDGCGAAYFKKRWYHGLEKINVKKTDSAVSFALCPACKMIKERLFEGKILLKNVPKKEEREILNFVSAYGQRAWDRDPMHRVIAAKKTSEGIVVTTTENQLANKMARKLAQVFNKVTKEISFSPGPSDIVYITITFTSN